MPKHMPAVTALQWHTSKVFYCVSKFSQRSSTTLEVDLFKLILKPISSSKYIDQSIFWS